MNLSSRIKEVLHPSESSEAAHGDVDHKTPGSFPVDDIKTTGDGPHSAVATSGSAPNKLHKSNDQRGWADDERKAPGHGYTDSGVGLTEHSDSAFTHQPGGTGFNVNQRDLDSGLHPEPLLDSKAELTPHPAALGTGATGAGTGGADSQLHRREGLEGSAPDTSKILADTPSRDIQQEEYDITQHGQDSTTNPDDHPYWGDIPHGTGVYNTVTGHGSSEEQAQRHQASQTGEHANTSSMGTSNLNTREPSDNSHTRAFPLVTDHHDIINDPQNLQEQTTSHHNTAAGTAAAAGIGAAGAGTYGAYQMEKKHEQGKDHTNTKETTDAPRVDDSKEGGLFSFFRGRKSDESKEKHQAKETKHAQHDSHPKEDSTGAFLHRGTDHMQQPSSQQQGAVPAQKDHDWDSKAAMGLTGAGVGGAAAYAASKGRGEHDESQKPTDSQHAPQRFTQGADSRYYAVNPETSGIGGHSTGTEEFASPPSYGTSQAPPTAGQAVQDHNMQQHAVPAVSGLGAGGLASSHAQRQRGDNLDAYGARDANQQHVAPSSQYSHDSTAEGIPSKHSHNIGRDATAAAGGIGAGGLAAWELDKHNRQKSSENSTSNTATQQPSTLSRDATVPERVSSQHALQDITGHSGNVGMPSTTASSTTGMGSKEHFAGSGTGTGTGTAAGAGTGIGSSQRDTSMSNTAISERSNTKTPPVTHAANHGQYNLLSSGTPSGINTDIVTSSNQQSHIANQARNQTSSQQLSKTSEPREHLSRSANQGEYNTLSTGTPSGINTQRQTHGTSYASRDTHATGDDDGQHHGYKAPATAAAAAATAAAYGGRQIEKNQSNKPVERDLGPQSKYSGASVPSGTGSASSKVIHRCQKCGEENDISSYFKSKLGGNGM